MRRFSKPHKTHETMCVIFSEKKCVFEKDKGNLPTADPAKQFSRPRRIWGEKNELLIDLIRSKTYFWIISKISNVGTFLIV